MLKIVERELDLGPMLNQEETERLKQILGYEGSLEDLNAALCEKLKSGEMDYQSDELIDHLQKSALGKLSIDNPEYAAYKRALEEAGIGPDELDLVELHDCFTPNELKSEKNRIASAAISG